MAKHAFSAENQPANRGRQPGSVGFKRLIVDALKRRGMDEDLFFAHILDRALNVEDPQSGQLLRELLQRMQPMPKATAPLITFAFPSGGTMVEKVDAIIKATSEGEIPADIAQIISGMLKDRMAIEETTELAERLERLEKMIAERGA